MASSTTDEENPVPVNATALIDIIFCLVLFFMCGLKFKQLEGYMDSWMPKGWGVQPSAIASLPPDEIRIAVRHDTGAVVTSFGARPVVDRYELARLIKETDAETIGAGQKAARVVIDAERGVPYPAVIAALDAVKLARGIDAHAEFALPLPNAP